MYHAGEGYHAPATRGLAAHVETHATTEGAEGIIRHVDERAVVEAAAEQELGLPCIALGALQARVQRCQDATRLARRELAALGALYDRLTLAGPDPSSAEAYRKAG